MTDLSEGQPPEPTQPTLEEYWSEVAALGIHDLVRMADGPDFVGQTAEGKYIRVLAPPPGAGEDDLMGALFFLTAQCKKWLH
jgi:hypothetical protein